MRYRPFYTGLLFLAIISVFPGISLADWSTFHGDISRTGYSDSEIINGDVLWQQNISNGYLDSSPVHSEGRVYVVSSGSSGNDAAVHCLDSENGNFLWNTSVPGKTYQLSTPTVSNGYLYVGSSSGTFHCINSENGEFVWQRFLDASINGTTSSPVVSDGEIFVGGGDGFLYCLSTLDGNTKWRFQTGAPIYFASPSLKEQYVYIGNDNGDLYCVRDGNELWNFHTGKRIRSSPAVSEDGMVFFSSRDGFLRCLDPNGSLVWERDVGSSISTPSVTHGFVVVGSENGLHAFDHDGNNMFTISTESTVDSSPVLTDSQIFFTTNSENGELISIDTKGESLWSYPLLEHVLASPAIDDERLFICSDAGKIWCFHTTDSGKLLMKLDPLPREIDAGNDIRISGNVSYESGKPGADADIILEIENNSYSKTTMPNGSFKFIIPGKFTPGTYYINVTADNRVQTISENLTLKITGKSGNNDNENDENFITLPSIPALIIALFVIPVIFKNSCKTNYKR